MGKGLNSEPMYYGADVTVQQLKGQVSAYQENLEVMSLKLSKQQEVLKEMKKQIEIADSELAAFRHAQSDVTNRLENTRKQRDAARKHVCRFKAKLEAASLDSMYYEYEMQKKIDSSTELIESLRSKVNLLPVACSDGAESYFETKEGQVYTTAVRELYYKLLADQLPPRESLAL